MPSRWLWKCTWCGEELTAPDQFRLWHMGQTHMRRSHSGSRVEHVLKMDRQEQAGHA